MEGPDRSVTMSQPRGHIMSVDSEKIKMNKMNTRSQNPWNRNYELARRTSLPDSSMDRALVYPSRVQTPPVLEQDNCASTPGNHVASMHQVHSHSYNNPRSMTVFIDSSSKFVGSMTTSSLLGQIQIKRITLK